MCLYVTVSLCVLGVCMSACMCAHAQTESLSLCVLACMLHFLCVCLSHVCVCACVFLV